jgi:hypothetical protein
MVFDTQQYQFQREGYNPQSNSRGKMNYSPRFAFQDPDLDPWNNPQFSVRIPNSSFLHALAPNADRQLLHISSSLPIQ